MGLSRMQRHIAKLRMKSTRLSGNPGGIAATRKAYERFFNRQGGWPHFRKVKKFRSFTLKQAGWKLLESEQKYGRVQIGTKVYKLVYHRPMQGDIKMVTIKRDTAGRLWICFSVVERFAVQKEVSAGQSGGFDFGLKCFLTNDEGQQIASPWFYRDDLPRLHSIQRQVSKKVKGSANRQKGKHHISCRHIRIDDKRRDFHFKLAHALCDQYDILCFEDLNINGMKRLWGRKVSDLGFAQLMNILEWVAFKCGKRVVKLDRWTPTTQVCSGCGQKHKLALKDRELNCDCGLVIDRDHNATKNILEAGHRPDLFRRRPAFTAEAH